MSDERTGAGRATARLTLAVRPEQREAVERLAQVSDLTINQVGRRLLDLGLASWTEGATAPVGVAS